MKPVLLSVAVICLLTGCTTYKVHQHDKSTTQEGETREILSDIKGTSWFSSAQAITGIKALQTDKTQSFGTDAVGQHGATNTVQMLEALAHLIGALPK